MRKSLLAVAIVSALTQGCITATSEKRNYGDYNTTYTSAGDDHEHEKTTTVHEHHHHNNSAYKFIANTVLFAGLVCVGTTIYHWIANDDARFCLSYLYKEKEAVVDPNPLTITPSNGYDQINVKVPQ